MKKLKTNGVIAFLLGAVILVGSIGHVAGLEGEKAYNAPDLLLTQGQAEYNLLNGIKYNNKKYELSVWDEGRFDINVPGNYTVQYLLTPVEPDSVAKETIAPSGGGGGHSWRCKGNHSGPGNNHATGNHSLSGNNRPTGNYISA